MIQFKIETEPPTATAQQKKVRIVCGRPQFYEPSNVKQAKAVLMAGMLPHRPAEPLEGPLYLRVWWMFGTKDNKKIGKWRDTRPDTDNLEKLLKDCLTQLGFWKDDSQVVCECASKEWVEKNKQGIVIVIQKMEEIPR